MERKSRMKTMNVTDQGKQIVKMLFNAKTQAEEEYAKGPNFDWKPIIFTSQLESMEALWGSPERWAQAKSWITEHFDVVDNQEMLLESRKSWAKIHEQLDKARFDILNMTYIAPKRGGKTRLGSRIAQGWIDEYARIPEVRSLPDVRDLGWTAGPFHFNEAGGLSESLEGSSHWRRIEEGPALQLQEWLQRRSVCRGALSCGLA
jgi:hypothetical protein